MNYFFVRESVENLNLNREYVEVTNTGFYSTAVESLLEISVRNEVMGTAFTVLSQSLFKSITILTKYECLYFSVFAGMGLKH